MKRTVAVFLVLTMFFTSYPAFAVEVVVADKPLKTDAPAFIKDSRTFVPMRAIFEALGAEVNYNRETGVVTGTKDGKTVSIKKPHIVNNRTFVPLRYISETLGAKVDWLTANHTAYIDSTVPKIEDLFPGTYQTVLYSPQNFETPSTHTIKLFKQEDGSYLYFETRKSHLDLWEHPNFFVASVFHQKGNSLMEDITKRTYFHLFINYDGEIDDVEILDISTIDAEFAKKVMEKFPGLKRKTVETNIDTRISAYPPLILRLINNQLNVNFDRSLPVPYSVYNFVLPPNKDDGKSNPPEGNFYKRIG